ncbi:MAG: hypothetical protein ABSE63_16125, partial [Thermoguttaceae bacterium]
MRDGEKFFAEGRDNANYELVQQQMKLAGNWRIGLRSTVLGQLAALGRNSQPRQAPGQVSRRMAGIGGGWEIVGGPGSIGPFETNLSLVTSQTEEVNGPMPSSSPVFRGFSTFTRGTLVRDGSELGESIETAGGTDKYLLDYDALGSLADDNKQKSLALDGDISIDEISGRGEHKEKYDFGGTVINRLELHFEPVSGNILEAGFGKRSRELANELFLAADMPRPGMAFGFVGESQAGFGVMAGVNFYAGDFQEDRFSLSSGRAYSETLSYNRRDHFGPWAGKPPHDEQWFTSLFPYLPPAERKTAAKEPKTLWSAESRSLAQSLLRNDQLAQLTGGLEINRSSESFDVRWGEVTSRSETISLVSNQKWLIRSQGGGQQTMVQWCNDKERGVFSKAFQLGQVRKSTPLDLTKPPLDLGLYTLNSLERSYPQCQVELKPQGDNRTLLAIRYPASPRSETDLMIDTQRHVILWIEERQDGKITSSTKCEDIVEAAGAWWAGRIETFDAEGRQTSRAVQQFKPLSPETLDQQVAQELTGRDQIQFLHEPLPKLIVAKQAIASGMANFDDNVVLMLHFARSQQWPRAMEYLEETKKLADGKPGLCWIRNAFLNVSRRREELKQHILAEAAQLAQSPSTGNQFIDDLFLANHLLGQSASILEANQMLALLDALKPVFERQPQYLLGLKQWNQQRANYLQQTGRSDEWLALEKQLAEQYPHDANLQQQYAQNLANSGDYESAYAWIARVLTDQARWLPNEEEMLRNCYAQLLEREGRFPELVDYLAGWMKRNPPGASPYQQYLSALVKSSRLDEADTLIEQWLKEGQTSGRLPPEASAKLQAAVQQALGQGYNLYTDRIDKRWEAALADSALFFAKSEFQQGMADNIMNNWRFQQTDQCRRVRKAAAELLKSDANKLPAEQIQRYISWIMPNDPAIEADVWKRLAAELHKRWAAETDATPKGQLAQSLVQVLSSRVGAEEHLAFLREQLDKATEENRTTCAATLFNTLLIQPWSAERENEVFSLLDKLSDAEESSVRLAVQVAALYRLTDHMVQDRYQASMAKIEHQEKLTRTELADKRAENLRLAREGFADRLKQEMQKQSEGIVPWLNIERLYLDVLLGRNLERAAEECWEYIGPKPKHAAADDDLGAVLEESLRHRYLITLMNLAARKGAKPELSERLLKYLDEALAADTEDMQWKMLKYQLLVALDRPKELEQALQSWIKPGDANNYWRLTLAYLLAEQGKIAEAVKLFETIEASDELGPREYRTLADWYMVLDRRELYEHSLVASYKSNEEWRLSNWLSQKLRPWQNGNEHPPGELDKEVMLVFAALFEKAGNPQNYSWQLREFYVATRDFRLLAGMADAVVGHTAGQVYPFLQSMGTVLGEIRDEATADSLIEHLVKVRDRAKTEIDQRALDMLELMVERRAAELKNQPGPHAEKALKAMRRAF